MSKTDPVDDTVLLELLTTMSRQLDALTERQFYSELATRYFDGNGLKTLYVDDLLSITALAVDTTADGTYDQSLTEDTDYRTWPFNESPKIRLDIMPDGTLGKWTLGEKAVQVTGTWGYNNETEDTGGTLGANIDATATSMTLTPGNVAEAGETIVIDTEQLHLSQNANGTLTITRGINGTTAASHTSGTAVYRRRYDRRAEQAVLMEAARIWREGATGYAGNVGSENWGFAFRSAYPAIAALIGPLRRGAAVI